MAVSLVTISGAPSRAATLPSGFIEQTIGTGWGEVAGLEFGKNSDGSKDRMYVWERAGKVWIVEDGVRLTTPLIDISPEVGAWRDYGLLGFALDPQFRQTGHFYLFYVVDRHHVLHAGTPQYNPAANEYMAATIGRITRYTARASDDFRSTDPASRRVLVGETRSTGFPILHQSHGTGALVFGTDGTLLAGCGDGASYESVDNGGAAGNAFGNQGVADGIITAAENVGAFRCQMLDSLSGKIIRIDPETGDGVAGNPFFEVAAPRSARSRVWAYGLRNPYRMCLKPGTGQHDPAVGDPGVLYVGDVGWTAREDLHVIDGPGVNCGWPLFEGMDQQPNYWSVRPAGMNAANHTRPVCDWRTNARVHVGGQVYLIGNGAGGVQGSNFSGNASTGGVWYSGTDFPAEWRDTYFHADYGGQWVRAFNFDLAHQVTSVRTFLAGAPVVYVATHPESGGLYYVPWGGGPRKISHAPGGNRPPVAIARADRLHGASPVTIHFSSALSADPENGALIYAWDFGDGQTASTANPTHTFTSTGGAKRFDVTLTVRDASGATGTDSLVVVVNNSPPVVNITSPADGTKYPLDQGNRTYNLTADVTDEQMSSLSHAWQTFLVHDNHSHSEPIVTTPSATTTISPLGGDADATYFYKIVLTVTDSFGLRTVAERFLLPDCGTTAVAVNDDTFRVTRGAGRLLDVLANDHGAVTDADFTTLQVISPPTQGTATIDPVTGHVRYVHAGSATAADSFSYRVRTKSGTLSAVANVGILVDAPPAGFNPPPVAMGDAGTCARGAPIVLNVLANDSDPGGAPAPASILIASPPAHGAVSLDPATGALTYFHNGSAAADDRFTYSVADAAGARSNDAVVHIAIGTPPANQPPVVNHPGDQSSIRGAAASVQIQATDPNGSALSFSATGLPAGLAINPSTGLISGTVSSAAAAANNPVVTVSDGILQSSVTFAWSTTAPPPQPTGNGLLGEFFSGTQFETRLATRTDATIAFFWPQGSGPVTGVHDNFSVRWTGKIQPPFSENYTFFIDADDGMRVSIDGHIIIDRWNPPAGTYWNVPSAPVALEAGRFHNLTVEFQDFFSDALAVLRWSSPRQPKQIVPETRLFLPDAGGDTTPPGATLTTATSTVSGPFSVAAAFSEGVTGLEASDFSVTNGNATNLIGAGTAFTLSVTPAAAGAVGITLPAGSCIDAAGNPNTASNLLAVTFAPPVPTENGLRGEYFSGTAFGSLLMTRIDARIDFFWPDGSGPAAGVHDNFSVRWTGKVQPQFSQNYTFFADADDGVRVWIGGQLILEHWNPVPGTYFDLPSTPIALVAGQFYDLKVEFQDFHSDALAVLEWASPSQPKQVVPAGRLFVPAESPPPQKGLTARYHNGRAFDTFISERIDPNINFYWGTNAPAAGVNADEFSVRWTGAVIPQFSETYTFHTRCDDGVRLWINNVLLIDRWTNPTTEEQQGAIALTANRPVPIRLEFFEATGNARADLRWSSPSRSRQIIPGSRFITSETGGLGEIIVTPAEDAAAEDSTISAAFVAAVNDVDDLECSLEIRAHGHGEWDVLFTRPGGIGDTVIHRLESSHDLVTWSAITTSPIVAALAGGREQLTIDAGHDHSAGRFFRVVILEAVP